jgi:hypothetical protein
VHPGPATKIFNGLTSQRQTVALGRFSFGPEIAYRFKTGASTFIEPQLTFLGLWNFDREQDIVLDGIAASPDTVTGRVEGGVVFGFQDGITFRAAGAYEGVAQEISVLGACGCGVACRWAPHRVPLPNLLAIFSHRTTTEHWLRGLS